MNTQLRSLLGWLPAVLMMITIFLFSARSANELPNYGSWDYFVKKSSHAVGYALLALTYLRALPTQKNIRKNYFLAWFLAVLYSATDEFHQSFVPGRHPSLVDVLVFDNLGAMIALILHHQFNQKDT